MPNYIDTLLAKALEPIQPTLNAIDQKKADLSAVSEVKKLDFARIAAARSTGKGSLGVGEFQWDMQNLSAGQIQQKYGPDAAKAFEQGLVGTHDQTMADYRALDDRHAGNVLWDTGTGVLAGGVGGVASILALGAGLVDDEAGAWASEKVQKGMGWVESIQSDGVNTARRQQRLESSLDASDNAVQMNQEIAAGGNDTVAGLKRWGRDVVDTVENSTDPAMLLQGTAEAAGSLLAGGPLAKGLKAIGATALASAGVRGAAFASGPMTAGAARVATAIDNAAWPTVSAALEGSSAYTGTVNEINNRSFDDLRQNSPHFAELEAQIGPEAARFKIANDAGMRAAAVQGTVGALTAGLTKWQETPFHVPSIRTAIKDVAGEGTEEFIQGTTGQLAQNEAVQTYADKTKNLSEGVGEQSALGVLYGVGSAGVVQAPGAIAATPAAIATGAAKAGSYALDKVKNGHFVQSILERGRLAEKELEKESPISDEAIKAAATDAVTTASETLSEFTAQVDATDATPEAKAAGVAYGQKLMDVLNFDPSDYSEVPNAQKPLIASATNRIEAIQNIADLVNRSTDPLEQFQAVAVLNSLMEPITSLREDDPEVLQNVEMSDRMRMMQKLVANITGTPAVSRALRSFDEVMAKAQSEALLQPVTEKSLDTVEGRQNVKNVIAVATLTPDKGNAGVIGQTLTHAKNGKLILTIPQYQALRGSQELLRARAKQEEIIAARGLKSAKDVVSSQIVAGNDPLRKIAKSALQHTNEILSAMRGSNVDLGAARLEDFGKFVQHMQNKVAALNQHFQQGGGDAVPYMALQANESRDFKQSRDGMYVNLRKLTSLDTAQSVALEASILADVYNGLVETFPDLGQPRIDSIPLDPALVGNPEELARKFREAERAPTKVEAPVEVKVEPEKVIVPDPINTKPVVVKEEPIIEDKDPEAVVEESPAVTNRQWMTGKVQELRPDNGRARLTVGDTTITYDRNDDGIKINLIQTAVGKTGKGSARKAMNAFLEMTDAANVVVNLTVAEQSKDTSHDALMKFYNSFGFDGEGDALVRPVDGAPVASTPVDATDDVSKEEAKVGDKLYEGDKNMFNASFNEPKEVKTNIHNDPTPLATVGKVLTSTLQFELAGLKTRNKLTAAVAAAYKNLLVGPKSAVSVLLKNAEANLQTFLNSPYSKKNPEKKVNIFRDGLEVTKENGDILFGGEMNRFTNGKVLNLVEQVGEGFKYNQALLEKAGLATIQWLLSAKNYESNMDASDIADMVGVATVNETLRIDLSEGLSTDQAVRSLGQKIAQYWGMDANRNTDDAYVEGIPQSMAAEMLRVLEQMELLDIKSVKISVDELKQMGLDDATKPKTFNRFVVKDIDETGDLKDLFPATSFIDAIEVAVMIEPEHTNYFGDEVSAVAERQMNNPEVANTPDQRAAIEKEQQTPFYIVPMMKTFFDNMGIDNLLSLFGDPNAVEEIDGKPNPNYNINHLKSLIGKNRSISAAFLHMQNVSADLQNAAEALGKDISDIAIRYAYNMSRVGRMQMLGKYNPQASKLVREVFSPTRSTLDLSGANAAHWNAYSLGLAQAFGIKIHNMSLADSQEALARMLNGPFDDAINMLIKWMENPSEFSTNQVETLREGFSAAGADLTMVGLHALIDYVHFSNTSNPTSFTTSLYVEADGVTNGPMNAMALMTIGAFSEAWVQNIEKGGLSLGGPKSLADIRKDNAQDLYQASTDATRERLTKLRNNIARQKKNSEKPLKMMDNLLSLMTMFSKDVIFDPNKAWDDGGLTMKRGIAKNPLTITIYGSGAKGIAGNLVDMLTDGIYEMFSAALQAQKIDPILTFAEAMFPDSLDPESDLKRFNVLLDTLTSQQVATYQGEMYVKNQPSDRQKFDPSTFTFNKVELENLNQNMLKLFVEPMRQGIEDTVGSKLFEAVGLLRDATQIQSVIYQFEYLKELDALMEDHAQNDPNWRQGDFVSRAEREQISKKLRKVAPLIKTDDQTFLASSNEKMEINGTDVIVGSSLDNKMRTGPSAYTPGQAGVRGIPMMVIGMGDGMMMQILAKLGLSGTLKIFDGMNMPLDKIKEQSLLANEAVWESWKGNPLREVANSFKTFLKNMDLNSINESTKDALIKTLYDFSEAPSEDNWDVTDIHDRMEALLVRLEEGARSIDARRQAMESVPMSVDQMASVAQPFSNGVEVIEGMTRADYVAQLNRRYEVAMASDKSILIDTSTRVVKETPVLPALPAPDPIIEAPSRVSKTTGVRVLTWENMSKVFKKATDAQKEIWGEIRRSLAAKEYKVVIGSTEQLDAHIAENGLSPRSDQEVFGWINIAEKTIYMVNPSAETLVHELVHASSYETILDHYNGTSGNDVKVAVEHLEALMADFLEMDTSEMTPEMLSSYDSARAAILSSNLETDSAVAQAKALNEFMAWGLTNQQLTNALKERKAPKVVQLVKSVVELIKKLIWGRRKAPAYADDFLSNLQFNSGIIFRSQPSIAQVARQGELFHSNAYGTNERLKSVRQMFGKKIIDYLAGDKIQSGVTTRRDVTIQAELNALSVALQMNAHGFPMTPQELVAFKLIVTALATEAEIDPNALARVQELYAHVVKTLKVEDFMDDPETGDPSARYYAQQKYDSVVGANIQLMDVKNRSSLLPAFLGLAVVSDEFRDILKKMQLPKTEKNRDRTLDAMLENFGNKVMDSLSDRLAGDTNSPNAMESIDNLLRHVQDSIHEEQSLLDKTMNRTGGLIDTANTYIKNGMEKLSDLGMEKASELDKKAKTVVGQLGARVMETLSAVVSEKNGLRVAEQTMAMVNASGMWEPFQKLMADLVGRTGSNALIYDLIKVTRTMVQQVRQQFREETPRIIMSKFKGKMTDKQWTTMFNAMARTDLAVLRTNKSHADIQALFSDQTKVDAEINTLEAAIKAVDPKHWGQLQVKMKQLAVFMNTGMQGVSLLRNAEAIAMLLGMPVAKGRKLLPAATIKQIDQLVTMYAIEGLTKEQKAEMASLVQNESEGLAFTLDYLDGQRKEEMAKATGKAKFNAYKGFIPSENQPGVNLIVADDEDFAKLRQRGFVRVADYNGSNIERNRSKHGYYYAPMSGRAVFNQGIMQNVRHTAGGVDITSGHTVHNMAGRITEQYMVRRLAARMVNEKASPESLMPIWGDAGQVIAFERPMDPAQLQRIKPSTHLPKMIGVWRGRQVEEGLSQVYNEKLIDSMKAMYENDMKESSSNQNQYVNLLAPNQLTSVQGDAVNLFTDQTMDYIQNTFGSEFWVRKDMLDDAIGYRSASVGDFWTGNTTWSPKTQETIRHLTMGVFGADAYRYLVGAEKVVQNFMADARTLIVVKSIVVPAANFASNMYQSISRGVPVLHIARTVPKKLAEIDSYTKSRLRLIDAEAELRAATGDFVAQRKLKSEIQSIEDAHRRLSIWPLIQAGEFSTIADVGMTSEDLEIGKGRFVERIEKWVDQLPESVRNAGRYAIITRDTALFQGLQKSVQYGDFIAKAVLYDDLVKRQKVSAKDALARITEEFVNYDRLPGRFRSYLENMGLLWFYNFKIRIAKVAVSTIRNNPVHALIAMGLPAPSGVDLPIGSDVFSKILDGSFHWSVGPEMGLRAPFLNPWLNIVD